MRYENNNSRPDSHPAIGLSIRTKQNPGAEPQGSESLSPQHILQVGMGFWASKTVLTAVGLKLFTLLAKRPLASASSLQRLVTGP